MNENEENKKSKIKQYALIKLDKNQLLRLYESFNAPEKEFREYLALHEKRFEKGVVEYYAIREDQTLIAQVTLMYDNPEIMNSTIENKRVYFKRLSILKKRANIGFENLLLELIISKLKEKKKNKIFEYTISIGNKERKTRDIIKSMGFKEDIEYINPETAKKELLYLRKDKEI